MKIMDSSILESIALLQNYSYTLPEMDEAEKDKLISETRDLMERFWKKYPDLFETLTGTMKSLKAPSDKILFLGFMAFISELSETEIQYFADAVKDGSQDWRK